MVNDLRAYDEDLAQKIKKYINDYSVSNGYGPSVREIAEEMKIHSSRAGRYMALLYERGEISRNAKGIYESNAISRTNTETESVAILGSVPCGPLTEVEECIEGYLRLPTAMIGKGKFFLLTAQGDSMVDAGINDGDLVLIRQQEEAKIGQIVVALVDHEVTLKRLRYQEETREYYLHPENKRMKDIFVDHFVIQGIAVKVFKDLV